MTELSPPGCGLPTGLQIDFSLESGDWPDSEQLLNWCKTAFSAAFRVGQLKALPESEVSLVFIDDEGIRELNARWRDKDKATNVLSFPGSDPDDEVYGPLLGDIVFASQTMQREAEELGIDFSDHLSHLAVHGLLHLFDYDHQEEDEAELMEELERRILADLGIADPYSEKPLAADET